ncbi:26S proteasome regulatory complex component [Metarhizium robertsii]|uniref:Proteasome regulatory particle, non-ATPase-like protein n=2 Tax=Metarhizium robertsii TaxID=568076 RepID=E9EP22_METRA|nr:proteasome regulatory particle, non-ATPase-like protein [Metarhizium robertsii ARSEF 23]EFZ02660.1 proteasome regulatory particle, non-ATPase-like protein [Metarhizium robertsii ARSEF 23]EXV05875.1 26S proteasome regulatory complex component [Metarhizium robertsii]
MGSDPQYAKWPLLPLSQHVFTLTNAYASKPAQEAAVKALQDAIAEDKMAPFYRYLAHPIDGILNAVGEGGALGPGKPLSRKSSLVGMVATKASTTSVNLPWDEALYSKLKEDNDKELAEFQKEEDEAVEQAGETEVMAAKGKRADFWARVGDKDKAIAAFEDVFEKTGILGTKIDLVLAIIRMGLFYGDKALVQKHIERAKTLVESGGDWDRRNRLKAYEGLHLLTVRSYNLAAPLLLDSLSTFTSYELCTYSNLVVYSVLAGSVSLKRVDFKSKVVDAPEIKAIMGDGEDKLMALTGALSAGPGADDTTGDKAPQAASTTAVNLTTLGSSSEQPEAEMAIDFSPLALLVSSLYNGNYKTFFQSLASVEEQFLNQDRYLHEHKSWFIREMRLRAYQQLLQSYRVVGLESMANDFGVTVDFLDRDLARFIAAGRIPCTIDRVTGKGVIETNRPDDKNKQYQDVVRQGDQLITKLQKYGQAVRLRGSERA